MFYKAVFMFQELMVDIENIGASAFGYVWTNDYPARLTIGSRVAQMKEQAFVSNVIEDLKYNANATVETTSYGSFYSCTISSHVHEYAEETERKNATCFEKGYVIRKCSCGENETEELDVDLSNHSGETEVRDKKAATCTEKGYTGDTYCKSDEQGNPIVNAKVYLEGKDVLETQTDENGFFEFKNLKAGMYNIFHYHNLKNGVAFCEVTPFLL